MKITKLLCYLILSVAILTSCGKDKPPIVTSVTPITITDFYPQKMITGRTLTIIGTNFDPIASNNVVKINGVAATVNYANATTIMVTIPDATTSGKITVNKGAVAATSTGDFTVMHNPYQNVRVSYITNTITKKRKVFSYDSTNRLTVLGNYTIDVLGILTLESTDTYTYTADGKLDKLTSESISPASKIKSVNQYSYVNNVLSTITHSTIDATNASIPVVKINSIDKYEFLNGQISMVINTDAQGNVGNVLKYSYSIEAGNPKMVISNTADISAQSPVLSTATILNYADVLSPLSLTLPSPQLSLLYDKNYVFSNVMGVYTFTYQLNPETGRITIGYLTPPATATSTEYYVYEDKI